MNKNNYFSFIELNGLTIGYFDINKIDRDQVANIKRLPYSIRILVENLLRKLDDSIVTRDDFLAIADWQPRYQTPREIPYHPARVLMQDFTGVPAVVDLAAMRDAVRELNGNPTSINPQVPVELVVDHSIQIDYYGTDSALTKNVTKEYERNSERYELLKWAQKSFRNFRVVPPNSGICHQVNLEHLGRVVISEDVDGRTLAFPDTLVGTDSHTPMINGIGVMGWGVGGIEAEAVMLGQPYYMSIPQVIGVKFVNALREGVTATDLVLFVTQTLRKHNVVEKFVEYFGSGMKNLNIPDRATLANMTPEYGATLGFFPIDEKTIDYLKLTDRIALAELTEAYAKANMLFYADTQEPEYTEVIEIDLAKVEPSIAGPSKPQDRIPLTDLKSTYSKLIKSSGTTAAYPMTINGRDFNLSDGSIVVAAITSCTNTSNPSVLIGAGLLAKRAVEKGLKVPPYIKTSFAPGSKVVADYLSAAGLMPYFEALGFHIAAYGCTTCIGNTGPLHPDIEDMIDTHELNVAAVLSGNRNFEARIHQKVKSNFLASPLLVVAFAIAGRMDIDVYNDPIGLDPNGDPVFLKDIWPTDHDIQSLVEKHVLSDFFQTGYAEIFTGDAFWRQLDVDESTTFKWKDASTYLKKPPYFDGFTRQPIPPGNIKDARMLLLLGDTVTTDHISPAGTIPADYPAGKYLLNHQVAKSDFNSYGSRRGNHEVMMRGTFANIRIKNQLVTPKEGGLTKKFPQNEEKFVFDTAMAYAQDETPLIVMGGKEYGTGSSRDWAAKGSALLGVKAVIAESFERIHRSNLVGMGVLPLVFISGENAKILGLDGSELFSIQGINSIFPRKELTVSARKMSGDLVAFKVTARLDTAIEVEYFKHGGILPYVLRKLMDAF